MTLRIDGHRPEHPHEQWSPRLSPIARIGSGDLVEIDVPDSSTGQLNERSTAANLAGLDYSKVDAGVGPIEVEGARPGDVLDIEIQALEAGRWGWTGVFRKFGFLRDRFEDDLTVWAIEDGWARPTAGFLTGVRIPTRPMLGVVGVAPARGEFGMIAPRQFGGNMDNRLIGAGATLELPVFVDGALVSVGDPHASQGDGEVCGTGIETPAHVRLRLTVRRPRRPLAYPRIRAALPAPLPGPHLVAMGISPRMRQATRLALENMIDALADRGFDVKSAYALLSVAGDLRLTEIVDEPNVVVSMTIAESLLRRTP
jgi:acetamidase/formamidase